MEYLYFRKKVAKLRQASHGSSRPAAGKRACMLLFPFFVTREGERAISFIQLFQYTNIFKEQPYCFKYTRVSLGTVKKGLKITYMLPLPLLFLHLQ